MRFAKVNKYRNAVATVTGRETWYSELSLDASASLGSNGLAISDDSLYLKTVSGNALQAGKVGGQVKVLSSTGGRVQDWNVSGFEDGLAIAGDDQGTVTLWKDHAAAGAFSAHSSGCVNATFHPTVAGLIATSSSTEIKLWNSLAPVWESASDGQIDSISVRGDGQLVAASTHVGSSVLFDLRQKQSVGSTAAFHASGRSTRVLWLGDKPFFMSTGQTRMRERSAAIWDQRNLAKPITSMQLQPSTKPLIPLYDEDTQLAYLAEKGDNIVRWVDADPSAAKPLTEFGAVALPSQISGCQWTGEIARLMVVLENAGAGSGSAVVPVTHIAPRRTYLDFHSDLFPDTRAPLPAQTFDEWLKNEPFSVPRIQGATVLESAPVKPVTPPPAAAAVVSAKSSPLADTPAVVSAPNPAIPALLPLQLRLRWPQAHRRCPPATTTEPCGGDLPHEQQQSPKVASPPPRAPDHARFKYLEGYMYKPTEHFTQIHDVNLRFPPENDALKVSPKYIAIALTGAGGQVGIVRRDTPGRVPAKMATVVHGATVTDIAFDPFNPSVIATAGADSTLQMWQIPDMPLTEEAHFDIEEYIHIAADRIHQIRFHPCAKGVVSVLATDAGDSVIYVYNGLMLHFIVGKTAEGIHSFAWSPDGESIALTTKKTKKLRVYDVRTSELVAEGPSMDSIRPCRIEWLDNERICLAGFGIGSQRMVSIHNIADLLLMLGPGILVPIFDPDCGVLYLDDRGSRLTHAFEVLGDKLVDLPKYESSQPSLCLAVLPKRHADVAKRELLRTYRLNAQTIESMGFKVPRKRPEFFQDDIFPPTVDRETPSIDAASWVDGTKAEPQYIDLCPSGMVPLSQAPPEIQEEEEDNTKDAISAMLSRVDSDWDD
ncbi:DUF1900-domain-containing protein [Linderina pennispora]|uniref:Coronin n=1 Tax=Linderina pennispora TaxID=61395 RepID=A0A1Y1VZ22_9FUNG|nr:DUF1900-domain-containing protein [Linderina pennispora]ORX66266.1 DUF1900-domain-containing protein [Linderina pennispora]